MKEQQTIVKCDLTGAVVGPGDRHTITVDGATWEIDVAPEAWDDLVGTVVRVVAAHGRPANRRAARDRSQRLTAGPAAIRAWARSEGIDVPDRGRLSQDVIDAHAAAHGAVCDA